MNEYFQLKIQSKTCSNHHLYKTTTCLRSLMLSLPKQNPIQLLLYKMTTCLTQPVTTFCLPNERNLSKTNTTKLYPAKKWGKNVVEQCIKNL